MPSIRTMFFLATATLASFVSAAPVGAIPGTDLLNNLPVPGTSNLLGNLPVPGTSNLAGNLPVRANIEFPRASVDVGAEVETRGASTPESLPAILEALEKALHEILDELNTVIGVQTEVDVKIILPIIAKLRVTLEGVLAGVEALVGLALDEVLSLAGKVLTIADIAGLLCTILGVRSYIFFFRIVIVYLTLII
ncbi:hypothetical protein L208DRAFT_870194 [Tricholoma matsutake]|nr:hypothetical protein L208DRAFT_870194 [Tricholoma matsutake 945]